VNTTADELLTNHLRSTESLDLDHRPHCFFEMHAM